MTRRHDATAQLGLAIGARSGRLELRPITLRAANAFVAEHHRHHGKARGCVFCLAVYDGDRLAGVAIAGRPVARGLDDGRTIELLRLATDGTEHAASKLLGATRRAARALAYDRVVTYTLADEPGTSLVAAGYRLDGEVRGRSWDTPTRRREDRHPTTDKLRWVA